MVFAVSLNNLKHQSLGLQHHSTNSTTCSNDTCLAMCVNDHHKPGVLVSFSLHQSQRITASYTITLTLTNGVLSISMSRKL